MLSLWTLWTTDALKSIGMIIPVASLVLILRAWRALGWKADGTWWGLALLAVTMALARIQQQTIFMMVISPHWYTLLPPPSLTLLAYGSGVVLLLGGMRLYRAALFPILLLLFANPIPHAFNVFVDLPLQYASAHIARAFAMSLGQPLTPDHLRLMFTPDFGMFIAPGCNGIRGSITMAYIALIAGYVYRFRWYANALVVTGAVLLGYVFNLLRLCLLVLYYLVALRFPWLQNKAENADYLIGGALFLLATLLLLTVIQRLRDGNQDVSKVVDVEGTGFQRRASRRQYAQLAAMGVTVLLGCAGMARANAATNPYIKTTVGKAIEPFPQRLGNYTLASTWNETASPGPIIYAWAQYAPAGGGTPVTVGVSPVLGWHDPLICHFTRGEKPYWQGQLTVATAGLVPISFSSAFYNDGATQYIEASTICSGSACGESATDRSHFGFLYTHPDSDSLLGADPRRPVPIVLRVETIDTAMPPDVAQRQLTQDLRTFLASVKLDDLTRPYSR
jgi:exosortase J